MGATLCRGACIVCAPALSTVGPLDWRAKMIKIRAAEAISVIANIGVLAGLGFLAYEIRQNTQAIESATIQALAQQTLDASMIGVENPELRVAFARASRGLEYVTPEDYSILTWWYTGLLRVAENRFQQTTLGTLSGDLNTLSSGSVLAYRNPFFGLFWPRVRSNYSTDFAEYVDATLLPLSQASALTAPPDLVLPEVRDALPRDGSSK